ncbi:MAG TPA: hypothetical protein VL336_06415 [Sphingomicrobium sp.]|nr:hypothetical protein [Sphingomicrobium sp.]
MAYYRLLFLNLRNDVVHAYDFRSRNDMEAMHIAEAKRGLSALELWQGARRIKRWDSFPPGE